MKLSMHRMFSRQKGRKKKKKRKITFALRQSPAEDRVNLSFVTVVDWLHCRWSTFVRIFVTLWEKFPEHGCVQCPRNCPVDGCTSWFTSLVRCNTYKGGGGEGGRPCRVALWLRGLREYLARMVTWSVFRKIFGIALWPTEINSVIARANKTPLATLAQYITRVYLSGEKTRIRSGTRSRLRLRINEKHVCSPRGLAW